MHYDTLTRDQRKVYEDTCTGTHRREIELTVLDKNGKALRSIVEDFMGGSVQGDEDQAPDQPVEVLTCDVFDPAGHLSWTHGEHRKYQLRVTDSRFIPDFDEWVEADVFQGPVWDFTREGDAVHLVAHGTERKAMGSVRRVYTTPRKVHAHRVVKDLLGLAGARRQELTVPYMKRETLPERVTVGVKRGRDKKKTRKDERRKVQIYRANREDTYWSAAYEIANAVDRDLFTDARGRFVMARRSSRPVVSFSRDQLLSVTQEKRGEAGEVTNTWHVYGANPKGPKGRIHTKVRLHKRHPLSPTSLAWHGKPHEVIETISNKHIRTKKRAREIGARQRDRAMRELVSHEVELMPVVPWLRPGCVVSIPTDSGRTSTRVRQWTLPLGPSPDPLTIGANVRRRF